jgi:hypothetical protein
LALAAGVPIAMLLAGCTAPLPDVSFYGGNATVATAPSLWCAPDADQTRVDCRVDTGDDGAPHLRLAKGGAVSVNVPAGVSNAPWVVLFQYRDANGTLQDGRGPLFASGLRQAYILHPPSADDQLVRVEVQSGLTPVATDTGTGVDYAATRTWVLLVDAA